VSNRKAVAIATAPLTCFLNEFVDVGGERHVGGLDVGDGRTLQIRAGSERTVLGTHRIRIQDLALNQQQVRLRGELNQAFAADTDADTRQLQRKMIA
jgi:hypothetical protein